MNKTQKSAIYCLAAFLFSAVVMAYSFISIFILKSWPESFFSRFWSMIAYFVFIVGSIIFLRKKQSPNEPDFDERDELIKKRAVLVSFVSICILLAAACIIPRFILGETGAIPVYVLTFINLGVFMIAMLVYNVVVLVQYGWGREGKSKLKM
ncbi:MAG TPA: hypothetical protein ENH34_02040 [Phycisphaerales bacterium]|nr:hypothetical protein [Phycisphaerales bacterium]